MWRDSNKVTVAWVGEGKEGSKQSFFEKKNQKTFTTPHLQQPGASFWNEAAQPAQGDKSFLLLFFKKEGLASLPLQTPPLCCMCETTRSFSKARVDRA